MAAHNPEYLYESIADRRPVDWSAAEESAASDSERRLIETLRLIDAIGRLHTSETPAQESADSLRRAAARIGTCWGSLKILEQIGRGSFGDVYRAHDPRLARDVALKILRFSSQESADAPEVIDEARLMAKVRHPNVVTVHGADRIGDEVGVWMELVEGSSLEDDLIKRGPLPVAEVVRVGIEVCRALDAVHGAGLLHRDVKARNVLRRADGRAVLTDFGIGHESQVSERASARSGTALYLAPELFGPDPPTIQSDVYGVSVLLYHLLTSSYPVSGQSWDDVAESHRCRRRVALRTSRSDVPKSLARIIERGLDPDPHQRFKTSAEMEHALDHSLRKGWQRRGALMATAAVLMLVAGASAIWRTNLSHVAVASRSDRQDKAASYFPHEPVTSSSGDAVRLYTQAYELGGGHNWEAARVLIVEALKKDPGFAAAHTWLAWCIRNTQGKPSDLQREAETGLALAGNVSEWERYWIRGSYYDLTGQYPEAIANYRRLQQVRPEFRWTAGNLRGAMAQLGRPIEQESRDELIRASQDGARAAATDIDENWKAIGALNRLGVGPEGLAEFADRIRAASVLPGADWDQSSIVWAWMFPAFETWHRHDAVGSASEVDRLLPKLGVGRFQLAIQVASHQLMLGRGAAALRAAEAIQQHDVRLMMLATVAFHRGDSRRFAKYAPDLLSAALRTFNTKEIIEVPRTFWVMTKTGMTTEASRLLATIGSSPGDDPQAAGRRAVGKMLEPHLAYANGDIDAAIRDLRGTVPAGNSGATAPGYRAAELLATALIRRGRHQEALQVLEAAINTKRTTVPLVVTGLYWMRTQLQLVKLYRHFGQADLARPLETELATLLAASDPDFPLLVELRRTVAGRSDSFEVP